MISVQCLALPKNLVNIQVSENLNAQKEIVLTNCVVVQLMCEIRHTWLLRIPSLLSAYNCGNARAQHIILDETVTHLISQISRNRKRKNSVSFFFHWIKTVVFISKTSQDITSKVVDFVKHISLIKSYLKNCFTFVL